MAVRGQLSLLTVDQVCKLLQVKRNWIYDEVQAGRFPVKRLGRLLRFRPEDIDAHLDGRWPPVAKVEPVRGRVGRPRSLLTSSRPTVDEGARR